MILRSLVTTLFCALLALTSVTHAVAQHSTVGVTQMVLCTDMGAQVVMLDAQGNPVPNSHPCPDCVAAIAAQDVPPAAAIPMPPLAAHVEALPQVARAVDGRSETPAHARGPPLLM